MYIRRKVFSRKFDPETGEERLFSVVHIIPDLEEEQREYGLTAKKLARRTSAILKKAGKLADGTVGNIVEISENLLKHPIDSIKSVAVGGYNGAKDGAKNIVNSVTNAEGLSDKVVALSKVIPSPGKLIVSLTDELSNFGHKLTPEKLTELCKRLEINPSSLLEHLPSTSKTGLSKSAIPHGLGPVGGLLSVNALQGALKKLSEGAKLDTKEVEALKEYLGSKKHQLDSKLVTPLVKAINGAGDIVKRGVIGVKNTGRTIFDPIGGAVGGFVKGVKDVGKDGVSGILKKTAEGFNNSSEEARLKGIKDYVDFLTTIGSRDYTNK